MGNKNVTAVEWLAQKLDIAPDNPLFEQAKVMEKKQIKKAFQMNYDYPDAIAASERYYQRNYDNGK